MTKGELIKHIECFSDEIEILTINQKDFDLIYKFNEYGTLTIIERK
jgi:hypothetical protein